mgnify:CR=1 FL=1
MADHSNEIQSQLSLYNGGTIENCSTIEECEELENKFKTILQSIEGKKVSSISFVLFIDWLGCCLKVKIRSKEMESRLCVICQVSSTFSCFISSFFLWLILWLSAWLGKWQVSGFASLSSLVFVSRMFFEWKYECLSIVSSEDCSKNWCLFLVRDVVVWISHNEVKWISSFDWIKSHIHWKQIKPHNKIRNKTWNDSWVEFDGWEVWI